ncbi:MAG: 2-oxoacid:acceptor oxidoreductase family protein [Anaerolineae bacterium]
MQRSVIIAGFGGQGVLFAGLLLAYAAMDEGLYVTWYPSYGPEMRGGTASATVVIGDEEVGSPVVLHPDAVIALNTPSFRKYEPMVKPGGVLVYNSSLTSEVIERTDIHYVAVPANAIASEIGDVRVANAVMVGAFAVVTGTLPLGTLVETVEKHMPPARRAMVFPNQEALRRGAQLVTRSKEPSNLVMLSRHMR